MNLPPPSGDEVARREHEIAARAEQQKPNGSKHPPLKVIGIAAAVLVGVGVLGAIGGSDDDDGGGGKRYTFTEAACKMLNDGDDPEEAYAAMKIIARQHPLAVGEDESIAARVAVNAAVAQGCG